MIISKILLAVIIVLVFIYEYKPTSAESFIFILVITVSLSISHYTRHIDLYLLECFYILMFFFMVKTDPSEQKIKKETPSYHAFLGIFFAISSVINLLYILVTQ